MSIKINNATKIVTYIDTRAATNIAADNATYNAINKVLEHVQIKKEDTDSRSHESRI